jgi:predicted N-acetyltransferase YhbS
MAGATWQIRPERPEDAAGVAALNDDGFGPGRFAKSAYRLREGVAPQCGLNFVAVENAELLGSVRFWPILVGTDEALLLGPLAVKSQLRGRGVGVALMQHGIEQARRTDFAAILLVGDEAYYARAGFKRIGGVKFPGPVDRSRILGLTLARDVGGDIRRARIDDPICADGAPLG